MVQINQMFNDNCCLCLVEKSPKLTLLLYCFSELIFYSVLLVCSQLYSF